MEAKVSEVVSGFEHVDSRYWMKVVVEEVMLEEEEEIMTMEDQVLLEVEM